MRDISRKVKSLRIATARSIVRVSPNTTELIKQGQIPKGDPLQVARVAAVQSAKGTSQIIPYCHPIPVEFVGVDFELTYNTIVTTTTVKAVYKTGVEMEALTAAAVAALTLYDMLKMLDNDMEITGVTLLSKKGGKSDFKQHCDEPLQAAVIVLSDSVAAGQKTDSSGKLIVERLSSEGVTVVDYLVIADDLETIEKTLLLCCDEMKLDLVVTTGGTGLSKRDCAPEAMARVLERQIPGITETARAYGQERTPYAMLSRSVAGVRGKTLIVSLPGSPGGVSDSLDALLPPLLHSFHIISGGGHHEHKKL